MVLIFDKGRDYLPILCMSITRFLHSRRIKVRHDQAHLPRGQRALAVVIARFKEVCQQLLALTDPPFELLAGRLGLAEREILRPQLLEAVASDFEMLLSHCLLSFFFLDMLSYQPLAKISTITYICTILYRDS